MSNFSYPLMCNSAENGQTVNVYNSLLIFAFSYFVVL